eukprot:Gregarina_sp_Poly_1__6135@NODE_323_length_9530_cov_14_322836_g275_i0_p4_GENE_NODE_323_length_9530_cov_14_322836_g275_i0NODE_323_length_9530_cov_14_322836_g275_i0_p4_ORF_typecomplete_len360_score38_84SNF2_N/PF00176_23/6_4e61ResIII/PF04851_15/3_8e15SWI2_SNF2/PF18766_1/0_0068DUF2075/PF09848_9/0_012AAA_14/PF13173_6/0_039Flavi_DEAD/PF07652_14/0_19TniB/PF05621_11/7e02TniB/PF05621_11/1_8TniB/PF05621_11/2_4e03_NODE_323_length_9530_cov_14_322836_g275_i04371516
MIECIMGLGRYPQEILSDADVPAAQGCILADAMGLGKSLQSIAAFWTLLANTNVSGTPFIKGVLILCPASLAGNWSCEIKKWLGDSCPHTTVMEKSLEKVVAKIDGFRFDKQSKVLIMSYETFRLRFQLVSRCKFDLLICDEAHRLKNIGAQVTAFVEKFECRKRLFLTGTPIQNDLEEFFTLSSLVNPTIFQDLPAFRRDYINPIVNGTKSDATDLQCARAEGQLKKLSAITNAFILRRENTLLSSVLPDKLLVHVFCNLSKTQIHLYKCLIDSIADEKRGNVLTVIQALLKVCTHPLLVPLSTISGSLQGTWDTAVEGLEDAKLKILLLQPSLGGNFHAPQYRHSLRFGLTKIFLVT